MYYNRTNRCSINNNNKIEEEIITTSEKMVHIIKDQEGNFVARNFAFTLTNEGWLYSYFTGITTGLTYYKNNDVGLVTATKELKQLQDINNKYRFGKVFFLELIDYNSIKMGEFIIEEVFKGIHSGSNKKIVNL